MSTKLCLLALSKGFILDNFFDKIYPLTRGGSFGSQSEQKRKIIRGFRKKEDNGYFRMKYTRGAGVVNRSSL